jgi:hypothetical protein
MFKNVGDIQAKLKRLKVDPKSRAKITVKELHTGIVWSVDFTIQELMELDPKIPNIKIPMPDFSDVYPQDIELIEEFNRPIFITALSEMDLANLIIKKSKNRMINKIKKKKDSDID